MVKGPVAGSFFSVDHICIYQEEEAWLSAPPCGTLESEEFEYVAAAERILAERVLAILVLPAAVLVLSASVLILRVLAVLILLR